MTKHMQIAVENDWIVLDVDEAFLNAEPHVRRAMIKRLRNARDNAIRSRAYFHKKHHRVWEQRALRNVKLSCANRVSSEGAHHYSDELDHLTAVVNKYWAAYNKCSATVDFHTQTIRRWERIAATRF